MFCWHYNKELMDFIEKLIEDTGGSYKKGALIEAMMRGDNITIFSADYLNGDTYGQVKNKRTVRAFKKNAGQIFLHYQALNSAVSFAHVNEPKIAFSKLSFDQKKAVFKKAIDSMSYKFIGWDFNEGDFTSMLLDTISKCLQIFDRINQGEMSVEPLSIEEKNGYLRTLNAIVKDAKFAKRTSGNIDKEVLEKAQFRSAIPKSVEEHNLAMSQFYKRIIEHITDINHDGFDEASKAQINQMTSTLEQISDSYIDGVLDPEDIHNKKVIEPKNNTDLVIWLLQNIKLVKPCITKKKGEGDDKMDEFLIDINEMVKDCNTTCKNKTLEQKTHSKKRVELIRDTTIQCVKMIDYLQKTYPEAMK